MSRNTLSALGRMSYSVHLTIYPTLAFLIGYGILPWYNKRQVVAKQKEQDDKPLAAKVDPDLFNPFSPIPYHNNPELKYAFANVKMHNYLEKNTHINEEDYFWKAYHNSYDHNNTNGYMYSWISLHDKTH